MYKKIWKFIAQNFLISIFDEFLKIVEGGGTQVLMGENYGV